MNTSLRSHVEALFLTGSARIGVGNERDNSLIGNDLANTLIGGAGNDTMGGGAGDDVYGVDSTGDSVVESGGNGFDTVYASVSFELAPNVEALILTGTAQDAIGNGLNNVLIGNAVANNIVGAGGSDAMAGGGGSDSFFFAPGFGLDIITDFSAASGAEHDTLVFSSTVFQNAAAALAASQQDGAGVLVALDATNSVFLQNVARTDLTADNFRFV